MTSNLPSDVDTAAEPAPVPPRAPRASVMLSATIEGFGGGAPTRHRVRDLSPGGMRIDHAGELQAGATVLVSVGVLEAVGATVKWVAAGTAGLAFATPIDPEQARMRAAIAPKRVEGIRPAATAAAPPKAGWFAELENPYRG